MRTSTSNNRPIGMDQLLILFSSSSQSPLPMFILHAWKYSSGRRFDRRFNRKCRVMRVIAGKYRSRPLRSLRGMDIRPTSDRLRETLFNVLTSGDPAALEGTVWLDLFAGTGALGIEALSRGAAMVYFVEASAKAAALIRKNLQAVGAESGFQVLQQDVLNGLGHLAKLGVAADFAFLDPPYA